MTPKRILVVAESIDVEDSSGSKANVALIHNLKKAMFEVLVLHYTRRNIQLDGIECISLPEDRNSLNFFLSRIQRKLQHWFNLNLAKYLEPRFGFSFTFFNDTNSIHRAIQKFNPKDFDLVITLSKGASFRPHYALLQTPDFHSKWMAYIHDPYPFHYYPEPYNWSEPGFQQKIEFFNNLSEKCKWAAFPSQLLKEWMKGKFKAFKSKSLVMPHQMVDNSEFKILPDYFNQKKFTLLHAGNLMKQRPPFCLIQAFKDFLKENPEAVANAELILLGNASYHKDELQNYQEAIENLQVRDYESFDIVQNLQKKVSVNIILESVAEVSPFLPGKFPHCIQAEKPILLLGPDRSESKRLLGEDYPYWSEANNVEKIKDLIQKLYAQWGHDKGEMTMQRNDLKVYMSKDYLQAEIEKILV